MHEIRITTGKIEMLATLNESPTAERIWDALPIESTVSTWGQQIYFSIPIQCDLGPEARDRMEIGEIAYWPTGSAFCAFFGKTPASKGDEPRAASLVNPVGRCEGDVKVFRQVREGETIRIEQIEVVEAPAEPADAAAPEPDETPAEAEEPSSEEAPAAPEPDETPAEAEEPSSEGAPAAPEPDETDAEDGPDLAEVAEAEEPSSEEADASAPEPDETDAEDA